tara:strand:+ start:170 stop:1525 length:1356 start_codon:yes stop_codon:yes gene_type:complete
MNYVGVSEGYHDASLAIITEEGNIVWAEHSERYSKVKNDPSLCSALLKEIQKDDILTFYESKLAVNANPLNYQYYVPHHVSHAAGAFMTRPWEDPSDTVMLTIDGWGEHESACIFDNNYNLLLEKNNRLSIGVLYSSTTHHLGLKPMEDEYVVMGLSSYGTCDPYWYNYLEEGYDTEPKDYFGYTKLMVKNLSKPDCAATVQKFCEDKIYELAKEARKHGSKLVYSGGVAQNIIANTKIRNMFDDMWIPTAVSDAGSALGCAAYTWGKHYSKTRINWEHPYLGHSIKERNVNPREVVQHLLKDKLCGVAHGRTEYGPRALGNRSLIADVRYDVKDTVNDIKQRQRYRPFAPAILEEHASSYFDGHMNEYMQYVSKALHDYKSVIHVDGTSRVQVVKKDCQSILRKILEEYYEETKVPMLLNTSLNIRGRPMVNTGKDARLFEQRYDVKVFM